MTAFYDQLYHVKTMFWKPKRWNKSCFRAGNRTQSSRLRGGNISKSAKEVLQLLSLIISRCFLPARCSFPGESLFRDFIEVTSVWIRKFLNSCSLSGEVYFNQSPFKTTTELKPSAPRCSCVRQELSRPLVSFPAVQTTLASRDLRSSSHRYLTSHQCLNTVLKAKMVN